MKYAKNNNNTMQYQTKTEQREVSPEDRESFMYWAITW